MKLLTFSDLHLEMPRMSSSLLPPLPNPSEYDVVVAAGDISYELQGVRWLDKFFPKDKPIIFVPGNHERYCNDFDTVEKMFADYQGRVNILNPGVIDIDLPLENGKYDSKRFIGATMWSDLQLKGYRNLDDNEYKRAIADFKWRFTPARMKHIHQQEMDFVSDHLLDDLELFGSNKGTVVVTHFVPTQLAISPRFNNDRFNPYFTNDQDWLMEKYKYDVHIFGHTHDRFDFIHPSGVRCINNCHGYVDETPGFEWKIITV